MPSWNPRYANHKAREAVLRYVRQMVEDGAVCAICGKPIDLDAPQWVVDNKDGNRKRAPWSLECDEIVPVSRGGSPIDRNNVQPTHRICNQRKGGGRHESIKSHKPKTSREW